jgi:hypothetical protein
MVGLEREKEREIVCERKSLWTLMWLKERDRESANVCVKERYLVFSQRQHECGRLRDSAC